MRRWSLAAVAAAALLAGAFSAYALTQPEIADGSTVGGIAVGGMSAAAAHAKVSKALAERLNRPVTAVRGPQSFVFQPANADVQVDVYALVAQAVDANKGSSFARAWRSLTGQNRSVDVPLRVTLDEQAVATWVKKIGTRFYVKPRSADVRPTETKLLPVLARSGQELDKSDLESGLIQALSRPSGARIVEINLKTLAPKFTDSELAQRYPRFLLVSRQLHQVRLFVNLKLKKVYPVAVGRPEYPTPTGRFKIFERDPHPAWYVPNSAWAGSLAGTVVPADSPANPIKARWLGFVFGAGFHGTTDDASIGHDSSHGCVRMHIKDIIALYPWVPMGTPVYVNK